MKKATKTIIAVVLLACVIVSVMLQPETVQAAKPQLLNAYTMMKGETYQINVIEAEENAKITYKTSKKSVATVNKKGVVTAKKVGKATITVTIKQNGKTFTGKMKITVKKNLTYIEGIARSYAELVYFYNACVDIATENGWAENDDVLAYFEECYNIVIAAGEVIDNPDDYSDEDAEAVLEAIVVMTESMINDVLPVIVESYE